MPKLFLSYSSTDKNSAKRIAQDLRSRGIEVWLDEWEIRVGECIPTKISEGLRESHFVAVLLSHASCQSAWVDREWKNKYWEEVETNTVRVLPILLEECEVPDLLKTKKYADFRENYENGLVELIASVDPICATRFVYPESEQLALGLIARVQSREEKLSGIFLDIIKSEVCSGDDTLRDFARSEVVGYKKVDTEDLLPDHRSISGYLTCSEINPMFMGWSESMANALAYMRSHVDDFWPFNFVFAQPIAAVEEKLESSSARKLLCVSLPRKSVTGNAGDVGEFNFYASGDAFASMYERIRMKLISLLSKHIL